MSKIRINGIDLEVEKGWTLLEAANFLGFEIPTLCHDDGLSPYGGCRLCLVQIGEGKKSKLVSSCTYPAEDGLVVHTDTVRVLEARKMMIELMLSTAPYSKKIQDLASKFGVKQVRFEPRNEECVLCGLCVRMCHEQMDGNAIGFVERGKDTRISTPFDKKTDECRLCGGCIYICPACELRCQGPDAEDAICNACLNLDPTCVEHYDELQCWMYDAGGCGTCVKEKS